ncbi:MAG TPA: ABC transporter substrate-binding protein [Acidobacteriota bacterium]|nr:ABC transporter substrate-binding protein [Acidobacteriota bacterium]
MNIKFLSSGMVLLLCISHLLMAMPADAGVATEQTRATADKVLTILNNPELRSAERKSERREQLRAAIYPRFDFAEMAKRSLGSQWSRRSAQEQSEFVRLFSDLLEKSYIDKIESYNGEKITYTRENQDQDRAEVFTKVITKKGEEFSVNYTLHATNGEWKIYDVVIENISLVNNYRAQFNRILAKSSFDELLRKLQAKVPDIKSVGTKS